MEDSINIKLYPKEFNYKVGDYVKFRKVVNNDISEFYQKYPELIFTVLKINIHTEPEEFFSETNDKWVNTNLQRLTINLKENHLDDDFDEFNENWLCPYDFNQ